MDRCKDDLIDVIADDIGVLASGLHIQSPVEGIDQPPSFKDADLMRSRRDACLEDMSFSKCADNLAIDVHVEPVVIGKDRRTFQDERIDLSLLCRGRRFLTGDASLNRCHNERARCQKQHERV